VILVPDPLSEDEALRVLGEVAKAKQGKYSTFHGDFQDGRLVNLAVETKVDRRALDAMYPRQRGERLRTLDTPVPEVR
jgi:hypothetical protein